MQLEGDIIAAINRRTVLIRFRPQVWKEIQRKKNTNIKFTTEVFNSYNRYYWLCISDGKSMESEWVTLYFNDILWLGCLARNQESEAEATLPLGIRWRSHTTREVLQTVRVKFLLYKRESCSSVWNSTTNRFPADFWAIALVSKEGFI